MSGSAKNWWQQLGALQIVGILLMAAAIVMLALRWQVPRDDSQLSRVAEVTSDRGSLLVRGWSNRSEVDRGSLVRVWMLVQNQSASPVQNVRLVDFQAPGFSVCWSADKPAVCNTDQDMKRSVNLAPGASALFFGDVTPAARAGRYYLAATYGWTNPKGGELRNVLQIGPIEVSSSANAAVVNLGRRVRDMIVPIALFVLGVWLQNVQHKRDDEQRESDDARALASAKTTAVLNSLLTASMRDTQRYYLPFAVRTSELIAAIGEAPGGDQQKKLCAFALVSFLRHERWMAENIAGLHFQNRCGENVAAGVWGVFRRCMAAHQISKEDRLAALRRIDLRETAEGFLDKLNDSVPANEPVRALTAKTLAWIGAPDTPLADLKPLLQIFRAVILFEINRPFDVWYGEREEFPAQQLTTWWSMIDAKLSTTMDGGVRHLWDEYLRDGQEWEADRIAEKEARKAARDRARSQR